MSPPRAAATQSQGDEGRGDGAPSNATKRYLNDLGALPGDVEKMNQRNASAFIDATKHELSAFKDKHDGVVSRWGVVGC